MNTDNLNETLAAKLREAMGQPPIVEDEPEVPPECWNPRPISAERCMQAVRAMCS